MLTSSEMGGHKLLFHTALSKTTELGALLRPQATRFLITNAREYKNGYDLFRKSRKLNAKGARVSWRCPLPASLSRFRSRSLYFSVNLPFFFFQLQTPIGRC